MVTNKHLKLLRTLMPCPKEAKTGFTNKYLARAKNQNRTLTKMKITIKPLVINRAITIVQLKFQC